MNVPVPDDEMSLKEIARILVDFRHEIRGQLSQLVRADVYRAEMVAYEARIKVLEADRAREEAERANTRKLAIGAVLATLGTIVASLIIIALK